MYISDMSALLEGEARYIIGKKIIDIKAEEYRLTIILEGGAEIEIFGSSYEGSALDVGLKYQRRSNEHTSSCKT